LLGVRIILVTLGGTGRQSSGDKKTRAMASTRSLLESARTHVDYNKGKADAVTGKGRTGARRGAEGKMGVRQGKKVCRSRGIARR